MNDDTISREALKKEINSQIEQATKVGIMVDADYLWSLLNYAIDNAPPAPDWTQCSEKQPESDGVYYVTVTFNGKSVTRDQVFHEGRWLPLGKLMVNGVSGEPEVIAWMEKPAPYQAPVLDLGRGM